MTDEEAPWKKKKKRCGRQIKGTGRRTLTAEGNDTRPREGGFEEGLVRSGGDSEPAPVAKKEQGVSAPPDVVKSKSSRKKSTSSPSLKTGIRL